MQTRDVAQAIHDKDFEKAMSLRDPEFVEILSAFYATSSLDDSRKLPTEKVSFNSIVCNLEPTGHFYCLETSHCNYAVSLFTFHPLGCIHDVHNVLIASVRRRAE